MNYIVSLVCVVIISLLISIGISKGHEHWINQEKLTDPISGEWCCNEYDCNPLPVGGVSQQRHGVLIFETGEIIPNDRIIWKSPDGQWWRCHRNDEQKSTRCLIGPPPST